MQLLERLFEAVSTSNINEIDRLVLDTRNYEVFPRQMTESQSHTARLISCTFEVLITESQEDQNVCVRRSITHWVCLAVLNRTLRLLSCSFEVLIKESQEANWNVCVRRSLLKKGQTRFGSSGTSKLSHTRSSHMQHMLFENRYRKTRASKKEFVLGVGGGRLP